MGSLGFFIVYVLMCIITMVSFASYFYDEDEDITWQILQCVFCMVLGLAWPVILIMGLISVLGWCLLLVSKRISKLVQRIKIGKQRNTRTSN